MDDEIEILDVDEDEVDYTKYKRVINKSKNTDIKSNYNYFGYNMRVYIYIISFIFIFIISSFILTKSFKYNPAHTIDYSEKSNVDYKVYLKDNTFYDDDYLEKDRLYIASIIKKIDINFDYDFFVNEDVDLDFKYDIVGKLLIQNEQRNSTYYEKEYVLKESDVLSLKTIDTHNISDSISIDYDYYNSLANSFKNEYKISPVSTLIVYFRVVKSGDSFTNLNDNSIMEVEIPLSRQSISISLNYKKINNDSKLLMKKNIELNNILLLIISIILYILSFIILYKLLKLNGYLLKRKSRYERYVNRLLKQYDRVIVNSYEEPDSFKSTIRMNKFNELLDLRDITKLPIKYYVPNSNKCMFYIDYDNKVYMYLVKKVDYEKG